MIHLAATSHGFHLLNGAGQQLSPYMLLSSSANHSGRMTSVDGQNWEWALPTDTAPYAIRATSQDSNGTTTISEITFYRIEDGQDLPIGVMTLDDPLQIEVTSPAAAGEVWTTDLALPFRMAVKDQALKVTGANGEDHFDLTDTKWSINDTITVHAKGGDDTITGGLGNDVLHGNAGNDVITDHYGSNTLKGGQGHDTLSVTSSNTQNELHGGKGHDHLSSGGGDDILRGGSGHDTLIAGSGDDRLIGGWGDDHLISGSGTDRLRGGAGDDAFEINGGLSGRAVIRDFNLDEDTLLLVNFNGGVDELMMKQKGDHLHLTDISGGFTLVLKNTDADDISDADIQFG